MVWQGSAVLGVTRRATRRATRRKLLAAAVILCCGWWPASTTAQEIINGNAEINDPAGQIQDWTAHPRTGSLTLSPDTADKSQGKQSARFDLLPPDGANFRASVGKLVCEAVTSPTTLQLSADAKFIIPPGKKATAYFRVYIGEEPLIIKIPPSDTWTTITHPITLQPNQRITSLDLSSAGDAGITLWLDNLKLTPLPAASPASTLQLQEKDDDGDGQVELLLENPFYALTLLPHQGGSIRSLRLKPSTDDIALTAPNLPQGLLNDVISSNAHSSSATAEWTHQIDHSQPGRIIITFQRPVDASENADAVSIVKTLVFDQNSPAIDVAIQLVTQGKSSSQSLGYAVKNLVAFSTQPTDFFIPDWSGVTHGQYLYDNTGASQNQYVRLPPQGWTALMTPQGSGLAYEAVQGNPAELYSWRKNRIATLEWKYGSGALVAGRDPLRYRLVAFQGLPHVDGMLDGAAAAWVVPDAPEPGSSLQATLLISGESKLRTLELAWRRLPDGPWMDAGRHLVRNDPATLAGSVSMSIAAMEPGTYVLRAALREGQEITSLVERPVIVGQPSGSFTLAATIKDIDQLGTVDIAGSIPVQPDLPITLTKRLPVAAHLVKGMAHAPFDGRTDSRGSAGSIAEWRGLSSLGVSYDTFSQDNGIHLTLRPQPFNAIQIRGDWQGHIYANSSALFPPDDTTPALATVQATHNTWRMMWDTPRVAEKLSFFYKPNTRGALADVAILLAEPGKTWKADDLPPLSLYASELQEPVGLMRDAMLNHFGKADTCLALSPTPSAQPVAAGKGQYLHLLTPALEAGTGIAAVTLILDLTQITPDSLLVLRLWDPLDPMRENMHAQLRVPGPGVYTITLDAPDMVFPGEETNAFPPRLDGPLAMNQLWLSVAASSAMTAQRVEVTLHRTSRDNALVEAAQWRRFILQGLFSDMSENRPWMLLSDKLPVRQEIMTNPAVATYRDSLLAILTNAEILRQLTPNDPIAIEYHDWLYQQIDRRKELPIPPLPADGDAPKWARLLRANWQLISAIPDWWIKNRRAPDGSFGGGVNDDTDLLQTWQCLPMVDDGPLGQAVLQAGIDIADLAWQHTLEEGINRRSLDSLHAYEEGVNQLALNAWWFYGDPFHFERLMTSARSTLKLLITTPDGRVHFGTPMLGIDQARHGFENPGRTQMFASLFLQPLYEVAMYNKNPLVIDRMKAWGDTWASYQKPGAFVQQVDIPTGKPAETFPYQRGPVDEWTAIWQVTRDDRYLAPMIMGFKPGEYWGFQPTYGDMPQAAIDWPAPVMDQIRAKYSHTGYTGLLLSGQRAGMESMLEKSYAWFSKYPYMDTAAHQRTDRVLTYHATTMYAAYLGAAPNRNRWVRFNAVSYEGLRAQDFAALVYDAGDNRLRVALYNFKHEPITGRMRLWRLEHGSYSLRQGIDTNDDGHIDNTSDTQSITLSPYDTLPITLPPRVVTVIELTQTQKLDDVHTRPDLGLSTRTTHLTPAGVEGIIHNIGAATATNVTIALLDVQGKEVARQSLGDLPAPLDLQAKHLAFTFPLPASDRNQYTLVVDPDHTTPEIYEPNNTLHLSKLQQPSTPHASAEQQP